MTGISSRAAAERLATILLVIPRGVMAFQNDNPTHVELRTEERSAIIDVHSEYTRLETKVRHHDARVVEEPSDKETARRLIRFFGTTSGTTNPS